MSNNEWVQEGTPRDDAEWTEEADDYGVPVEPAEWDDYSNEQAMPVPPRPVKPEADAAPAAETPAEVDQIEEPTLPLEGHDENAAADPAEDSVFANDDEVVADGAIVEAPAPVDPDVEGTVFADDQPVDAANDDVAREVSERIDAEQVELHRDDAVPADDLSHQDDLARDDEMFATDEVRGDEYAEEPRDGEFHDEPAEGDAPIFVNDEPVFEDRTLTDEPVLGEEARLADEARAEDEAFDEQDPRVSEDRALDDEPVTDGATRVEPDELDLEETALVDQVDDEPTTAREDVGFGRPVHPDPAVPVVAGASGAAGAALAAPGAPMAGLYRGEDSDETQVLDTTSERRTLEDEAREEEARAAALRAEKEERDRRLGMVQTSSENAERELRPRRKGVGPFGSFGLFVLRLITAAILGIVAYQVLYSIDATTEFLSRQPMIPEPRMVAWIIGFALAAMAVMLVIGLGVRVVGLVLAILAVATLALIRWGNFSPFVDGMEGFLGDKDLLLAGVGILFLSLGGGRFGIDGVIARSREEAREARRA